MRGKAAAKSANKRANEAGERVRHLEQQLTDLRSQHRQEVTELKTQLAQAQGRLVSEVRNLSKLEVQEAHTAATAQVTAVQERHRSQVIDGIRFLDEHGGWSLPLEDWPTFARLLGIDVSELLQFSPGDGRIVRRSTYKKGRRYVEEGLQAAYPREYH